MGLVEPAEQLRKEVYEGLKRQATQQGKEGQWKLGHLTFFTMDVEDVQPDKAVTITVSELIYVRYRYIIAIGNYGNYYKPIILVRMGDTV